MPVVLRVKGYRFWFYESDLNEPPHVHVGKEDDEAKFWLAPVSLTRVHGFRSHQLREIERIISQYHDDLLASWKQEVEKRGYR